MLDIGQLLVDKYHNAQNFDTSDDRVPRDFGTSNVHLDVLSRTKIIKFKI